MHKIGQLGKILGRPLEPLLKTGLSLRINVLKPLPESVLIPLRLTAAASSTDDENVWIWYASFGLSKANTINNF